MEGSLEYHDLLDSRHFRIAVKRLADSLAYGTDRSPFFGSGIEYVQSRPYLPGDLIRSVDCRFSNHEPNKVFQTANRAAEARSAAVE